MNNHIQESIDRRLSTMTVTPQDRAHVLAALNEDKPCIRKTPNIRFAFVLTLVLIALTAVAIAVGLSYSGKYMATRTARQALMDEYHLTQEMVKMFASEQTRNEKGQAQIRFYNQDGSQFVNAEAMGWYTVTLDDKGAASVTWSHDDVDAALWQNGDLTAPAWGAPQLKALLEKYALYQQWQDAHPSIHELPMAEQERLYQELHQLMAPLKLVDGPIHTTADVALMMEDATQPVTMPSDVAPLSPTPQPGDLSAEQLKVLARQAMAEEFGLTEQELDAFLITVYYQYNADGDCCVDFNGYEAGGYVVMRPADGQVQEVWLDSPLDSNG